MGTRGAWGTRQRGHAPNDIDDPANVQSGPILAIDRRQWTALVTQPEAVVRQTYALRVVVMRILVRVEDRRVVIEPRVQVAVRDMISHAGPEQGVILDRGIGRHRTPTRRTCR